MIIEFFGFAIEDCELDCMYLQPNGTTSHTTQHGFVFIAQDPRLDIKTNL